MINAIVTWYLGLSSVGQIIVPAFAIAIVMLVFYLIRGLLSRARDIMRRVSEQRPGGRQRLDPSLQTQTEQDSTRTTLRERLEAMRREEQRAHADRRRG